MVTCNLLLTILCSVIKVEANYNIFAVRLVDRKGGARPGWTFVTRYWAGSYICYPICHTSGNACPIYFSVSTSICSVLLCVRESISVWVTSSPMESPSKYSAFNDLFLSSMSENAARAGRRARNMTSQTWFRLYSDIACNMQYSKRSCQLKTFDHNVNHLKQQISRAMCYNWYTITSTASWINDITIEMHSCLSH